MAQVVHCHELWAVTAGQTQHGARGEGQAGVQVAELLILQVRGRQHARLLVDALLHHLVLLLVAIGFGSRDLEDLLAELVLTRRDPVHAWSRPRGSSCTGLCSLIERLPHQSTKIPRNEHILSFITWLVSCPPRNGP